jgi:hypothetical protein
VRSTVIYQGLFLIALALYAEASRRHRSTSGDPVLAHSKEAQTIASGDSAGSRPVVPIDLEMLHRELQFIPVFRAGIPGVRLGASADRIEIVFESDELYSLNGIELQKVWLDSLEQIGEVVYLRLEPTLELEIIGFEDPDGPVTPGLGVRRAEFILGFFQNRLQEQRARRVRVSGGGKPRQNQRIELRVVRRSL